MKLNRSPAWVSALSLLCVLIVMTPGATAQTAGRLEGRLTHANGSGVSGATVTIVNTGLSTLTDANGFFVLEPTPAGSFSVAFSLGPNVMTVDDVRVEGGRSMLERTVDWNVGFADATTVYAASRRTERLFDAPASVAVVTAPTIALEAPHGQLPKLLEATPGVEMTQSGIFDFNLNIRGLNAALTRRVLTLVDGRDPASVLIGAQEWAAFGVPLDEVARIEIVRGPGAALYGANAFNGVIDITTRHPRYAQGGQADVTIGGTGSTRMSARYAGALGTRVFYRVHGAYGRTDDFYRSRSGSVEYAGLPREVLDLPRDRTEFINSGARVDHHGPGGQVATIEGGAARTDGNVFLTGAGRIQNTGAYRPWVRSMVQTRQWRLSGYYDGRYGEMMSLTAGSMIVDRSMKTGAEAQRRFDYAAGKGRLVAGGAYRFQRADTRDEAGRSTILRDVQQAHEQSAFAQIDHALSDTVKLMAATRLDDSSLHSLQVSPKAALVYAATPTQSLRVSYGHAFQTGSFVHYFTRTAAAPAVALGAVEAAIRPALGSVALGFDTVPVLAFGNEQLKVERVDSFETGYSGVFRRRVLIGANYYYNRINDLITPLIPQVGTEFGRVNPAFQPYVPPATLNPAQQALVLTALRTALPASLFPTMSNDADGSPVFAVASYTNLAGARLQGTEWSVQFFANDRVLVDAGYAALQFTSTQRLIEPLVTANAPPHKVTTGVTYNGDKLTVSMRYRWSDSFHWSGGVFRGLVPAASVVDVNGRFKLRPATSLQVNVANLFDNEHFELFGGDLLQRRALVSLIQRW